MNKALFKLFVMGMAVVIISGTNITIDEKPANSKLLSNEEVCYAATGEAVTIPQVTTGVNVENAKEYMGFTAMVNRDELPTGMESFDKIAVSISEVPFVIESDQDLFYLSDYSSAYIHDTYGSIVKKEGTWYVLVVLCDADKKVIGYYQTSVLVMVTRLDVPQASNGVAVTMAEECNGFKVVVTRALLPSNMKKFTKMAISISESSFEAEKGLPYGSTNSAKFYKDNTYISSVNKAGKWYVLIVLSNIKNEALGYYETTITVGSEPKVLTPLIASGISVTGATSYTGYDITIDRNSLPDYAKDYSKIGIATSNMLPFNMSSNELPFDLNSILSYKESKDGIVRIGTMITEGRQYVLIALYDDYNNPLGYLDAYVDVVKVQMGN